MFGEEGGLLGEAIYQSEEEDLSSNQCALELKHRGAYFSSMYPCLLFENISKWDFLPPGAESVKAFICQIRNRGERKYSVALLQLQWMAEILT